jgi:hypothetical protein
MSSHLYDYEIAALAAAVEPDQRTRLNRRYPRIIPHVERCDYDLEKVLDARKRISEKTGLPKIFSYICVKRKAEILQVLEEK